MLKYQFHSIKTRILVTFIPIILITLILISLISYWFSYHLLNEQIEQSSVKSLHMITDEINDQLAQPTYFLSSFASTAGALVNEISIEKYNQIAIDHLKDSSLAYAYGLFFANQTYAQGTKYRSMYAYHEDGQFKTSTAYDDPKYNYLQQKWYMDSIAAKGQAIYTKPYYDEVLKAKFITIGQAFYRPGDRTPAGVATADLYLNNIEDKVNKLNTGNNGSSILLDQDGVVLASSTPLTKQGDKALAVFGGSLSTMMLNNHSGNAVWDTKARYKVLYSTIEQTGWKIIILLPVSEVERPLHQLLLLLGIVCIVGLLIILTSIWWNNRDLIREIRIIRELSRKMAKGDYSQHLHSTRRDEFGQMTEEFNYIMVGMSAIMSTLRTEANVVHHSADLLSSGMQEAAATAHVNVEQMNQLHQGTQVQLISASESTIAMEEMAIGIQRISESVQAVSEATYSIDMQTKQSNEHIGEVNLQMYVAKDALDKVDEVIQSLNERSEQIGEVIHFIHEIGGQTKLLALNATIEAARAGEHGRGFGVVASEIGKLAESVSISANRITSQIIEMQQQTRSAMQGMQEGSVQVDNGLELLHEIKERFTVIGNHVARVAGEVQEVSSASEEMSASTEQISASLTQLSHIAHISATYSEEALQRSREQLDLLDTLNGSTDSLQKVTMKLNEIVGTIRIRD